MDRSPQFKYSKTQLTMRRVVTGAVIVAACLVILFPLLLRINASLADRPCAANLGEIGKAMALYSADNDQHLPDIVDASDKYLHLWDKQPKLLKLVKKFPLMQVPLRGYVKSPSVFHCSLDSGGYVMDNSFGNSLSPFENAPSMFATYGSSYLYRTEITFRSLSEKGFWPGPDVAMMFDAYGHWHGHTEAIREDTPFAQSANSIEDYRYNVLFGDGHVRFLTFEGLQATWNVRM